MWALTPITYGNAPMHPVRLTKSSLSVLLLVIERFSQHPHKYLQHNTANSSSG